MKKIFNWTIGSFFRTIGRTLAYIAFGLLAFLAYSYATNAETITPQNATFMACYNDYNGTDISIPSTCSSRNQLGTAVELDSQKLLDYFQTRIYFSTALKKNVVYTITVTYVVQPNYFSSDITNNANNWFNNNLLAGPNNTSSGASEDYISTSSVSFSPVSGQPNRFKATYKIVFTEAVKYIQIVLQPKRQDLRYNGQLIWYLRYYNVRSDMTITTTSSNSDDTASAIENQTIIIQNGFSGLNDSFNDINESINDDNIDESTDEASSFFNNFTTDTHGLTSVITAPLTAIQSLTSKSCSTLHIPIPFLNNKYLDLPCMRNIYEDYFGDFLDLYDLITLGIVSYWILVRVFNLVKDFKNPDHDEIEVMDL